MKILDQDHVVISHRTRKYAESYLSIDSILRHFEQQLI